ncbi:glycosyltransferase family 39 protein [Luteimonas yindakuii]|uniref:glycosyltransferase family 39 protein n=1 Tax=Luteimonas yindakuii TaxID=2565782 RepID=UPI001FC93E3F|nr:glycosyltransferase family 39 protein [Luteimonas yindakuii]
MPTDIDMRSAGVRAWNPRHVFIALWVAVTLIKIVLAARLPLFVDEAFYWQEGQHPAWAYSDLPGLTAWLIRVGVEIGGHHVLAVRAPFLLMAALLPWWMVDLVRRELDERHAWVAGIAVLLLPLAGTLGLLALPDVAMALATLACVDAAARLVRKVDAGGATLLAFGLAVGALSHYRFAAVVGVGFVALLCLQGGRRALRDPRAWIAIAFGAAAWAPLLAWNFDNAEAGLRFQLVDRHPWALHGEGLLFLPVQAGVVTPLLFVALLVAAWHGVRSREPVRRLFALLGGLLVAGFFLLGFFADVERVSFHWPLPGYIALIPLLPALLDAWPRWLRTATWSLAAAGLVAFLGYYAAVSAPSLREQAAAAKWYPSNFAGWDELAAAVADAHAQMPAGTRIVADNFKIGAELGFALGNPRIAVLDHPLNRDHGRAPQLRLWGLEAQGAREVAQGSVLLVVGATDVKFSELLAHYQSLCARFGRLPHAEAVNIDHGGRRFLLLRFDGPSPGGSGPCVTPVVAHLQEPAAGTAVDREFRVYGWAVKDGVGVREVRLTLDGTVVATADYGQENSWVGEFLHGRSNDPGQPAVAFSAQVDASALPAGDYWLGMEIEGADGSVEVWSERRIHLR